MLSSLWHWLRSWFVNDKIVNLDKVKFPTIFIQVKPGPLDIYGNLDSLVYFTLNWPPNIDTKSLIEILASLLLKLESAGFHPILHEALNKKISGLGQAVDNEIEKLIYQLNANGTMNQSIMGQTNNSQHDIVIYPSEVFSGKNNNNSSSNNM